MIRQIIVAAMLTGAPVAYAAAPAPIGSRAGPDGTCSGEDAAPTA